MISYQVDVEEHEPLADQFKIEGLPADHWCTKGHIVHCLEGDFASELNRRVAPDPLRYVSHPTLSSLIMASGMLLFGTDDWGVRFFDLVLSIPVLL